MIKNKENLNYDYYNRYLINFKGSEVIHLEFINEFYIKRLHILPEHEVDPDGVKFLDEFIDFIIENEELLRPFLSDKNLN